MMVKLLVVVLAIAACLNSQVEAGCCKSVELIPCDSCGAAYNAYGDNMLCSPSEFKDKCCDCDSD